MKRRIVLILLLLISGAIANVAVAWGCAAWSLGTPNEYIYHSPETSKTNGTFGMPVAIVRINGVGRTRTRSDYGRLHPWTADRMHYYDQVGIPFRSMEGSMHLNFCCAAGTDYLWAWRMPDGLWAGGGLDDYLARFLPVRPILPDFIINSLVYALLVWLVFCAPFAATRMLRRRRGLCAKCAYPIGVSRVCTECGAAVVASVTRSS